MKQEHNLNLSRESESYRALALSAIIETPTYWSSVATACRVGETIAAHTSHAHTTKLDQQSLARAIESGSVDHTSRCADFAFAASEKTSPQPANEADRHLAKAREAFRLAANSILPLDIERHAGIGRKSLVLAHRTAQLIDAQPDSLFKNTEPKKPADD